MSLLFAALLSLAAPPPPSVAIFTLDAATGVPKALADLLTDNLTDSIRRSGAFSRVVSSRELESIVGFERQKQLMDCDAQSCMAEVAGSLGVDMLVVGNIGRVGNSLLLNLRLLDVVHGRVLASISERYESPTDERLLDAIRPAAARLLSEAGLTHSIPSEVHAATATSTGKVPLLVAGGVGMVVGLLLLVAAGSLGATTLAGYAVTRFVYVPVLGVLPWQQRELAVNAGLVAAAIVAGLVGVVSLAMAGAGGASVALGASRGSGS